MGAVSEIRNSFRETSGKSYVAIAAAVAGSALALATGIGSSVGVDSEAGKITDFFELDETLYGGFDVATDSTAKAEAKLGGLTIGSASTRVKATARALVGQKNEKVEYSYDLDERTVSIKIEEKDLMYRLFLPPELKETKGQENGQIQLLGDMVTQITSMKIKGHTITGPLGNKMKSDRDAINSTLIQLAEYGNLDAGFKCVPLAYDLFMEERIKEANIDKFMTELQQNHPDWDVQPKDVKIDLPKHISVPKNKYSKINDELTEGMAGISVEKRGGECTATETAKNRAEELLSAGK